MTQPDCDKTEYSVACQRKRLRMVLSLMLKCIYIPPVTCVDEVYRTLFFLVFKGMNKCFIGMFDWIGGLDPGF